MRMISFLDTLGEASRRVVADGSVAAQAHDQDDVQERRGRDPAQR
jgi:hypothetical protein